MLNLKFVNEVPSCSGLYLIGNICLNQHTDKLLYTVKIGQSKNLKRRINQYYTYNPFFKLLDYIYVNPKNLLKEEKDYHRILGVRSKWTSGEWFVVEEDIYLKLVKNGFGILNFTF